jgi:ribonuclease P protein component
MIIVSDKAGEVSSERMRQSALKVFKKMEWTEGLDLGAMPND